MPLKPDNPSHRSISDTLDSQFGGQFLYDKIVRPAGHGTYHAVRSLGIDISHLSNAGDQFQASGSNLIGAAKNIIPCVLLADSQACSNTVDQLSTAATEIGRGILFSSKAVDINAEEVARAKDQFSKIGTGQQQSEYLETLRQKQKEDLETLRQKQK